MKFIDKEYWIDESSNYNKRFNLNEDLSQWSAWLIKASSVPKLKDYKKVSKRERPIVFINQKYLDQEGQVLTKSVYWIIVLRRKYIPPYLDKMDEVLIVMQNPAEALLRDTSFPEPENYYRTNYKIHDPSPNDIDENGSEVRSKVDANFGKLSWDFSVPHAS
jgi:hypothetical protein